MCLFGVRFLNVYLATQHLNYKNNLRMTTYSDCSLGRLVAQFGKGLGSKWLKLKSLHDFEPVE